VGHQRKLRLLAQLQPVLGFALRFCKRIARRKEIRIQAGATEGRERDIATAARGLKCPLKGVSGMLEVLGP
jgi:hypothetical protein